MTPPRITTVPKPSGCWIAAAVVLIAVAILAVIGFELFGDHPDYLPKWR